MNYLLRRLWKAGLERGLSGGNWAWLLMAASAFLLRRAMRPSTLSTSIGMKPGDTVIVSMRDPGDPADNGS